VVRASPNVLLLLQAFIQSVLTSVPPVIFLLLKSASAGQHGLASSAGIHLSPVSILDLEVCLTIRAAPLVCEDVFLL
jgi:hypothetical protein